MSDTTGIKCDMCDAPAVVFVRVPVPVISFTTPDYSASVVRDRNYCDRHAPPVPDAAECLANQPT